MRTDTPTIETVEELRRLYAEPVGRVLKKQLSRLDRHCLRYVELAPFVVVATSGAEGGLDASPRGGAPGFVHAPDDATLWIPDSPGNNRLDSLANIVATGRIGLLFLVPGVEETLRVNGRAHVTTDPEVLARFADDRRTPKTAIVVSVEEAYLHCAKALLRSGLWTDERRVDRSVLPTMGEMMKDQVGMEGPPETQAEMLARYAPDL